MTENDPEKRRLLGLEQAAATSRGMINVGDRVRITGVVTRIHKSGFCQVEVEGMAEKGVLIHAENVEVLLG